MAQSNRQVRMFAAEDYLAVYDSYINANFQAFDFDTIRESMVTYIQTQYPENFNDWIESSDFVALLDVVAQFGHNLAFRNDLNARNNFLSTSERQDSVFKLAEFLGYVPRRNTPASGQLKITSVKTNEKVLASDGSSLAGKELRFETSSTSATLDDFIAVMNSIFSLNNQFGNPRKTATINNIPTEFYTLNNLDDQIVFEFTGSVAGQSKPFNVYSLDYDINNRITYEVTPDPQSAFNIVYKNDGRGISSTNTGFFAGFKQGTLAFKDFNIEEPISNLTLDVDVNNINQDDVWVEKIDESGAVVTKWNRVSSINGFNEIYNNAPKSERNIFSVKTRADNRVSVMFPDKSFGNVPQGLIRVWYRIGTNQSYVLRPDDIGSKIINIKYTGIDGNLYTAKFGVSLLTTISNASVSETLDEIKQNAPRSYSAQDRMITADDYNNFLITQSTQIAKIKTVNRTHSGHSRFINPNDPTGVYSNLKLYETDGKFSVTQTISKENTNNIVTQLVYDRYIKTILDNQELINFYYNKYYNISLTQNDSYSDKYWKPSGNDTISGYFTDASNAIASNNDGGWMSQIKVGSLVKLEEVDGDNALQANGQVVWARVINIYNGGLGVNSSNGLPSGLNQRGSGSITLDQNVKYRSRLTMVYPPFSRTFAPSERNDIISQLNSNESNEFVIKYNYNTQTFETQIVDGLNPNQPFDPADPWIIHVERNSDQSYDIRTRIVKYTLSSANTEFSNITNEYRLDYDTKKKKRDSVDIFVNGVSQGKFYIYGYDYDLNGVYYSDRVNLVLEDANSDGRPDSPDSPLAIITSTIPQEDLRFEWTHVPDNNQIIDPSFSNIIDSFILTKSYDTEFRNWLIKTDNVLLDIPLPPTSDQLTRQFSNTANKKAASDTIVYRSVKYKVLFGNVANDDARASFQVIKAVGSTMTDNEIKSRIIESIYQFFDIDNWDFGETFYFTELAAYVHKQLTGEISSFVVVPESVNSVFGKLFQITPMSDELFIPDVSLADINMVTSITQQNIKAEY